MIFDNVFMNKRSFAEGLSFQQEIDKTAKPLGRDRYVTAFWILCGEVGKEDLEEILRDGCALLRPKAKPSANKEAFETIWSRYQQATNDNLLRTLDVLNRGVSQRVGS